MVFCRDTPELIALCWMDSKPVHMLATGASTGEGVVERRDKRGHMQQIPCPKAMLDYHKWMGGVDIHDQLRLQRYSLQLSMRFKKYYKSLFLGLVDMALVNAFIIYKLRKEQDREKVSRDIFLSTLQRQLLAMTDEEFDADPDIHAMSASPHNHQHHLQESPEYQVVGTRKKRRQRACKVCSLLRRAGSSRSYNSKYFCATCSVGQKRIYLCDRVRRQETGNTLTCSQLWHSRWKNGTRFPPNVQNRIKLRSVSDVPGKKRKRVRQPSDDM